MDQSENEALIWLYLHTLFKLIIIAYLLVWIKAK